jgi:hypothetical protein
MIYYITVHWQSPRWIKLQHEMLQMHTGANYTIISWLDGISDDYNRYFDRVIRRPHDPPHFEKLDIMAGIATAESLNHNDWIVFIDGDAFPVAPMAEKLSTYLGQNPLVAVQRLENSGDIQPHPCFCATTTGFWKKYQPTWAPGFYWKNSYGKPTTDVGGQLLQMLDSRHVSWSKLHRSNTFDLHPLLFGIYDQMIYHHGAGFRNDALVRRDYNDHIDAIQRIDGRILLRLTPKKYMYWMRRSILHPQGRKSRKLIAARNRLSMEIYQRLQEDPHGVITELMDNPILP